jgi:hypothetical protein
VKEAKLKDHMLYNFINMAFWKTRNYRNKSVVAKGWMWEELITMAAQGKLRDDGWIESFFLISDFLVVLLRQGLTRSWICNLSASVS